MFHRCAADMASTAFSKEWAATYLPSYVPCLTMVAKTTKCVMKKDHSRSECFMKSSRVQVPGPRCSRALGLCAHLMPHTRPWVAMPGYHRTHPRSAPRLSVSIAASDLWMCCSLRALISQHPDIEDPADCKLSLGSCLLGTPGRETLR